MGDAYTVDSSNTAPVTLNNLIATLQDGTTSSQDIVTVIMSQGINFTVSAEAEAMIESVTDSDTAQQVIAALRATFYNGSTTTSPTPTTTATNSKQTAEQWVQKNLFTTTGAVSSIGIAALVFGAVMLMQRK